jgi:hypothetical protein
MTGSRAAISTGIGTPPLASQHNGRPESLAAVERLFSRRVGRDISARRAILDHSVVHIPDLEREPGYAPEVTRHAWPSGADFAERDVGYDRSAMRQ